MEWVKEAQKEVDLLKETPAEHILAKLNELLAACTTLKARIDIIEDHMIFLLSKSPDYLKLMKANAEKTANGKTEEQIL